jgi:hypothetical protein
MKPPPFIDGARVVAWAWSGEKPFGHVFGGDPSDAVFGLAVAIYDKSGSVYRFSCDAQWETVQDSTYSSVDGAKSRVPLQYQNAPIVWHAYEQNAQNA